MLIQNIAKIWNVFNSSRKGIVCIVLAGVIFGMIPNITQLLFLSNEVEFVRESKEKYGKYGFRVAEPSEKDVSILKKESNVDEIYADEFQLTEYKNHYCNWHMSEKFDLKMLGVTVVEGSLPAREGEICVDENYFNKYPKQKKKIGSKILIPITKKEKKEYTVSGIVRDKTVFTENDEFTFFVYKKNYQRNSVYVSLRDYSEMNNYGEKIEKKLQGKPYVNFDLYLSMGYGLKYNFFDQNNMLYKGLYGILLITVCIVLYHLAKICMYDSSESISILRIIGINKNILAISFIARFLALILLGILVGECGSFAIFAVEQYILYASFAYMGEVLEIYSVVKLMQSILLCLLMCVIVLLPLVWKIMFQSANELLRKENLFFKKRKRTNVFSLKSRFVGLKIAIHEMKNEIIMSLSGVLGIVLGIVIITGVFYYVKINYDKVDDNRNYETVIKLFDSADFWEDGYDAKIEKLRKNNYGFTKRVKTHSLFYNNVQLKLQSKQVPEQYRKYLEQDSTNRQMLSFGGSIEVQAVLLGYEDKELNELFTINGLEGKHLKDGEVVMLDHIYSNSMNTKDFASPFQSNDTVKIEKGENGEEELKIDCKIKKLTIYPDHDNFIMVFVANERTFENITEEKQPRYVYIDDINYDADKEVLQKLENDSDISVVNLKEKFDKMEEDKTILNVFMITAFLLCMAIAITVMYSGYYMKIHIRRKEYAMLHTIGFRKSKIFRMVYLEIGGAYLLGCLISIIAANVITKYLYLLKYPEEGNYLYHFPMEVFTIANMFSIMVTVFVVCAILKKASKVLTIKMLHEL
ncbi:MAG: ABC transporter permease [Lachnospiraceae bacterium]|nr:ABC transporter permease [Lachnospiraceae bacterium]